MFQSLSFRELTSDMGDLRNSLKSTWPIWVFCLVAMLGSRPFAKSHLAVVPVKLNRGKLRPQNIHLLGTAHNVIVVKKLDDCKFILQYEDGEEAGRPWVQPICDDYLMSGCTWLEAKGFSEGLILDKVNFVDAGECWSLNPDNQASWYNRKDAKGNYVRVSQ